jgi:hypothetical protein
MKKYFWLISIALLLNACVSMSMKTLYKLATTDPMTVDPVQLRAAVRMPEWLLPKPDSVKLDLTSTLVGDKPLTEHFILESLPAAMESRALQSEYKPGYGLYAYRISPRDIPRFLQFRNDVKARKAKSSNAAKGAISVSAEACRKSVLPDGALLISTYLRFETDMDYLPLVVDYDIKKSVKEQDLITKIPACGKK